jgi:hypothetical protein
MSEATATELHQRYRAELAVDQRDASRLEVLRDKATDTGLSHDELIERMALEYARVDREQRLQRLQYEVGIAQDEIDTQQLLTEDDELRAEKAANYAEIERCTNALMLAYKALFQTHQKQEETRGALPRAGSNLSHFPSGPELAQNIATRLPRGWDGTVNSAHQQAWSIDWHTVKDVDPGLRPLEETTVGRIRETARQYREKFAQQIATAADEGADDE